MRTHQRSSLVKYVVLFLIYAAVMGLYVWVTSPNTVPAEYRGGPADPATFFTPQQLEDSAKLNSARYWITFMSGPWEWLIYGFLLLGGLSRYWREMLERRFPIVIRFPIFVLLVQAASFLLYLPLRIFGYSLSKNYGISTQPVASWIRDKLVAFGIGYVTVLVVAAVAFWIISRGGRWWLKLWLLSIPFIVFMMYIQPVVIDPIYNDYYRLSDPALEQSILDLAAKADIPADRVYEVNMSKKTNSINAYVNGLGSSLRIVLWDTTLMKLTEQQILLIMAHEMGHYVKHHLEWSALGAVGSSLALLFIGSVLYRWAVRKWGNRLGIRSLSDMTALPLILLLLSLISFVSMPLSNAISRNAESASDTYAFELIGNSEGAVSMYQTMTITGLGDVNPPSLIKWIWNTHPTDMERIMRAVQYAEQHGR
ncbi:MAG: M48 family metallopeptidase [Candidatus Cohnella colombiensis]|uniref:M48 family metallopeptidase n=1 Tax=Candidatus Cohnella colombiensis TaxID=3121368 RepID=A0AA95JB67_9BACL|nr:MAG: M48 family metallopeptidase [Cohnella sp.]